MLRGSPLALCLLFFIALSAKLQAQVPEFDWAIGLGPATATALAETSFVDPSGNVFVTGRFTGTMDFDPGPGTFTMTPGNSGGDGFILKLDVAGNFVWAKQLVGSNTTWSRDVTVDASGNVYATGIFQGTVDCDPGTSTFIVTSAGNYDVFVVKLDASGNFVWAGGMGGAQQEDVTDIEVDKDGNVITSGAFPGPGSADFDPGPGVFNLTTPGLQYNAFISKLNSSGNFVFALRMGGTQTTAPRGLDVDESGNIYSVGEFRGTADFDPGTGVFNQTSAGLADVYITKLDGSGNLLWAKKFGGTANELNFGVALDATGNIHLGGAFTETTDFDPGPGTFNLTYTGTAFLDDTYIVKLDNDGNFIWARSFGGPDSSDDILGITVDTWGNVYTAGTFDGECDFDTGTSVLNVTPNSSDSFVHKLDAAGNFISAQIISGPATQQARDINVNSAGNISTTGYFGNTADFDPTTGVTNLTSAGTQSIFVQRMTSVQSCNVPKPSITHNGPVTFCTGGSVKLNAPSGYTYEWSTSETTQEITVTTSGNFSVTVSDGGGCSNSSDPIEVIATNGACTNLPPAIATASMPIKVEDSGTINLIPLITDEDSNLDLSTLKVIWPPPSGAEATITGGVLTVNYNGVSFSGEEQLTISVCDLSGACSQQVITLNVNGEIKIYNAISPNGDGLNDTWTIDHIAALNETKENKVSVFNRWGDEVFSVENYDNKTKVFTGLNKGGNELTSGTYYYRIEFAKETLTGYLVLRR